MNVLPVQPNLASFDRFTKIVFLSTATNGPCFNLGSALSLRKRILQIGVFADDWTSYAITARLLFKLNNSVQQQINLNSVFPIPATGTINPLFTVTKVSAANLPNAAARKATPFSENQDEIFIPYSDGAGGTFYYAISCSPMTFNCDCNAIELCIDSISLVSDGTHTGFAAAFVSLMSFTP